MREGGRETLSIRTSLCVLACACTRFTYPPNAKQIFNISSFIIYVLVNLGLQNADKLRSLRKQAEADRVHGEVGFIVGDNFMSECLQDSDMYRQQRDAQEDEWERDLLERELEADPQRTDCGMVVLQEEDETTSKASFTFGDASDPFGGCISRNKHMTLARKRDEPRPRHQDKTFSRKPPQRVVVLDRSARTWRLALVEWKSHLQDLDLWMRFLFPVAFGVYVGSMYAMHSCNLEQYRTLFGFVPSIVVECRSMMPFTCLYPLDP